MGLRRTPCIMHMIGMQCWIWRRQTVPCGRNLIMCEDEWLFYDRGMFSSCHDSGD